jgi:hypothetical protein
MKECIGMHTVVGSHRLAWSMQLVKHQSLLKYQIRRRLLKILPLLHACTHRFAHRRWSSSPSPGQVSAKVVQKSSEKPKRRRRKDFMACLCAAALSFRREKRLKGVCPENFTQVYKGGQIRRIWYPSTESI